jgi:GAF domain-containing protein
MANNPPINFSANSDKLAIGDVGLRKFAQRLNTNIQRNSLVQEILDQTRLLLQVDRVVIYYFYNHWEGQVTFQSLKYPYLSIFGSKGADHCFNDDYAKMYLADRIMITNDVETAGIHSCHLEFLRSINVKANLVAPILNPKVHWGLLIAHHCQSVKNWTSTDIKIIQRSAKILGNSPGIKLITDLSSH